jgi:hypothetical protein
MKDIYELESLSKFYQPYEQNTAYEQTSASPWKRTKELSTYDSGTESYRHLFASSPGQKQLSLHLDQHQEKAHCPQ